ncbi:Histone methylation protein DOT1 [Seminavis robusta]|uniref:Histone methylation protein DOT1 n=1 Tax=Seminavis robusta TaxID=568900 RepID=A0A9N8HG64_9STRA|nr:Histone methylation protein DOT1 [Seminavis robusta]|eukprot:Sro467_g149000.1 Histone methylation protein DOT1 (333) ;mRNA; f:58333-59331
MSVEVAAPSCNNDENGESHNKQQYVIPSFLDVLLQSEFRILHQPPPLQANETQDDRDFVDHLLDTCWDATVSRSLLNSHEEDEGKEFTYGEITPTGVRQLLEDLELLTIFEDDSNSTDKEEVVFYDLGSGEGKLVAQVFLETLSTCHDNDKTKPKDRAILKRIVGIELSPARHAMAVHSWNALQQALLPSQAEKKNSHHQDYPSEADSDPEGIPASPAVLVDLQEAKASLRAKFATANRNTVELVHGDLSQLDFSDATHIYASSIFFPPPVLEAMSQTIMDYSTAHGKLKMVAALSDLELLETEDSGWEKRVQRLQMSWGGANVRLYSPKDY